MDLLSSLIFMMALIHFKMLLLGIVSSATGIIGVTTHILYLQTLREFSNGNLLSPSSIAAFGDYLVEFILVSHSIFSF